MAQENLGPWLEERGKIGGIRVQAVPIRAEKIDYRLMSIATAVRKGYIRLPENFEGRDLLIRRLLEFPLGDSDDLLAAFALLSAQLERRGHQLPGLSPGAPPWNVQPWKKPGRPGWPS